MSPKTLQPIATAPKVGKRQPLYQQMVTDLHRRIENGELQPGGPAPSESELIGEFGVSSTTARRCLNELAQSGLVYRVQGRGTFVSELAGINATKQIGIFYHDLADLTDGFMANALRGVHEAVDGRGVQPALLTLGGVAGAHDPAAALRSLVQRHQLDALLILSPLPPHWLGLTLDLGLPVAAVNFEYADDRIDCVLTNHAGAVNEMVADVEARGHRRGVALRGRFDPTLVEGVKMTELNLPANGPVDWTLESYPYFEPGAIAELAAQHLARKRPPTVFLCWGYEVAMEVAAVARDRGLAVPDDLSIVFIGSPPNPTQYTGRLVPTQAMARCAASRLAERLKSDTMPSPAAPLETLQNPGTTLGLCAEPSSSACD